MAQDGAYRYPLVEPLVADHLGTFSILLGLWNIPLALQFSTEVDSGKVGFHSRSRGELLLANIAGPVEDTDRSLLVQNQLLPKILLNVNINLAVEISDVLY